MFSNLIDKYGDDFNWWIPNNMEFLNKQIKRELVEEHKLYGETLMPIAKCESNDDVLYQSKDRFYIVHLLWKKGNKESPSFFEFINLEEAIDYIEKDYVNKFKG